MFTSVRLLFPNYRHRFYMYLWHMFNYNLLIHSNTKFRDTFKIQLKTTCFALYF